MVRVLLVANKTLGSGEVSEFVRNRMGEEECQFTLLVPATPRSYRGAGVRSCQRERGCCRPPAPRRTTTSMPALDWNTGWEYSGAWAQTWMATSETQTPRKRLAKC